jgi:hypothetical protein
MSGTFTDQTVNEWLQQIAEKAFCSLHYDSPAMGGVGAAEISGGGYRRIKVSFSQPSNRVIWSLADVRWTGLEQTQITHFGLWNTARKGALLAYGPLPEKRVVLNGQGYSIREGELALSFG